MSVPGLVGRSATYSAAAVGIYAIVLGALLTPSLNRFALYAHKINTHFWDDIDQPESFGFGKNQVTPFNISTPDGETLYAWHVLPLNVYANVASGLAAGAADAEDPAFEGRTDYTRSMPFSLLRNDPKARVVVSFHGNAGHIAQGWRTDTARYLATQPNTHVITLDYRGFGKSSGSPTEEGLIIDGIAAVNFVLNDVGIPPERIMLLGQSLGTAVASAVGLSFADPGGLEPKHLSDATAVALRGPTGTREPVVFAGIVLVAPFSSIPSLMLTYRLGGLVPLLAPLRPLPWLANALTARMTDKWFTAERLALYYNAPVFANGSGMMNRGDPGSVQIIHAVNDMDISYRQSEMIAKRVLGEKNGGIDGLEGDGYKAILREGHPGFRVEIVGHGGHNRLVTYTPVAVAVMRAFEPLSVDAGGHRFAKPLRT